MFNFPAYIDISILYVDFSLFFRHEILVRRHTRHIETQSIPLIKTGRGKNSAVFRLLLGFENSSFKGYIG